MSEVDIEFIKNRARGLTHYGRRLFTVTIAERLFPLYELYSATTKLGVPQRLRVALNRLWENKSDANTKCFNTDELLTLAPSEDAQWSALNPLAENAVDACVYACLSYVSDDADAAAWAAVQGYEAVDYVAHTLGRIRFSDPNAGQRILDSPIVQEELLRQLRDVNELAELHSDAVGAANLSDVLRSRARSEGASLADAASELAGIRSE